LTYNLRGGIGKKGKKKGKDRLGKHHAVERRSRHFTAELLDPKNVTYLRIAGKKGQGEEK